MRKNKIIIFILIIFLVLSVAVIAITKFNTAENKIAKIYQNNQMVQEIALDTLMEPVEFEITDHHGHINIVRAERGKVCMISADCPDQTCVNQGWIDSGVVPIVCLPNKIIVEIIGTKKQFDAQTGG